MNSTQWVLLIYVMCGVSLIWYSIGAALMTQADFLMKVFFTFFEIFEGTAVNFLFVSLYQMPEST